MCPSNCEYLSLNIGREDGERELRRKTKHDWSVDGGYVCIRQRADEHSLSPCSFREREREKKRGGPFAHTHSISWLRSVERREPKSVAPQIAYSTHTFFHSSPVEFCLFLSLASRQRRNRKHWKRQES